MRRCGLVCFLLAGSVWAQTAKTASSTPAQKAQAPAAPGAAAQPAAQPADSSAAVPPDAPVITINGLCDYSATGKFSDPKCKRVITRAEFDLVIELVRPGAKSRYSRDIAHTYVDTLVKGEKGLAMGLDKKPDFAGKLEVLRLLFYAKKLNQIFEDEEWKKVTDKEIEDYYRNNPAEFLVVDIDRIFLPRFEVDDKPNESEAEKAKRQQAWDKTLKEKADELRARSVAGGDFLQLQNEAYKFTGVSEVTGPQEVTLKGVRRKMFDPDQRSVMDLKPGETSLPLYDETRGYCIFRVDTKSMLPLEKVRGEIHKMFQMERVKQDMDAVQKEATVVYNDAYLGPESPEESSAATAGQATPASLSK